MPTHPKVTDYLEYLESINTDRIRPTVLRFEGITDAAGAPPRTLSYSIPDDRHLFLFKIGGFIEPDVTGVIAAAEANLSERVTVDVTINENEKLFVGPASTINMAQLIGDSQYTRDGIEFPFPYHIIPKSTIKVDFATFGFPAAQRRLGIFFKAVLTKVAGSGM